MKKYKKIWKNRKLILNGILNRLFPTPTTKEIAEYRLDLCRGCKYYDPKGESEAAILKGEPACSICGCNIFLLTASMDAICSREDIGETPLWEDEKRYRNEE